MNYGRSLLGYDMTDAPRAGSGWPRTSSHQIPNFVQRVREVHTLMETWLRRVRLGDSTYAWSAEGGLMDVKEEGRMKHVLAVVPMALVLAVSHSPDRQEFDRMAADMLTAVDVEWADRSNEACPGENAVPTGHSNAVEAEDEDVGPLARMVVVGFDSQWSVLASLTSDLEGHVWSDSRLSLSRYLSRVGRTSASVAMVVCKEQRPKIRGIHVFLDIGSWSPQYHGRI